MPSIRTRGGGEKKQRSYHYQTRRFSVVWLIVFGPLQRNKKTKTIVDPVHKTLLALITITYKIDMIIDKIKVKFTL